MTSAFIITFQYLDETKSQLKYAIAESMSDSNFTSDDVISIAKMFHFDPKDLHGFIELSSNHQIFWSLFRFAQTPLKHFMGKTFKLITANNHLIHQPRIVTQKNNNNNKLERGMILPEKHHVGIYGNCKTYFFDVETFASLSPNDLEKLFGFPIHFYESQLTRTLYPVDYMNLEDAQKFVGQLLIVIPVVSPNIYQQYTGDCTQ